MGSFSLTDPDGKSLCPQGQKPTALLAYLLYHAGRDISREKLVDLFWTDRQPKQGRDSLRQGLYILRLALAEYADNLLEIGRYAVGARRESICSDLWTDNGDIRWDLAKPFLEDLGSFAPRFDDWVSETGRAIRSQQIAAAERRLAELDPAGDADAALQCAEAILALDAHNEPAARHAIRILASQGKKGHALRVYERLREALNVDDFEVSPATHELIRAISENRLAEAVITSAPPPPTSSGAGRWLPSVRIDLSDADYDPGTRQYVSDFFDHLVLRFVQMPELRLITAEDSVDGGNYVVFVSAGKTGSGLRLSLRLRGPNDQFLWSGRVDLLHAPTDDQVLLTVDKLVMQMLPALEEHMYFSLDDKLATAYGCYIQAKRTFWTDPQSGYIDEVLSCLHRAIEIDPEFLPPYSMLIMYYNTGMFMSRPGMDHGEKRAIAFELSQKLLFLNSKHANSHISMGWCLLWRGNFDAAERSIRRAMELNPYEPHRLSVIGTALVYLGHHDEGERYYDMAQERLHHDFDFQRTDYGELYFLNHDYEKALSWMEVPEIRTPYKTLFFRAAANAELNRQAEAQADVDAFVEDIRGRWAGPTPFTPDAGFQWYADMLPLRAQSDRRTVQSAMTKLGLAVKVRGLA